MNPLRNQLSRFSAFGFKIWRRRKSEKGKIPDTVRVSIQAAVRQCQSDPKNISDRRSLRIFTAVEFCEWRRREERIKRGRRRQKRVFKGKLSKIAMSWEGSATCNPTWRNAISVMAECAA
ncbi:hypothetical protein VNO80_15124 [Phaseolus coccineus]|uniref:Uncharacterized protein n=1 Tax=Phaseolus coccineus TaxID=3886 RepID=A0AAN9MJA4_PHACN